MNQDYTYNLRSGDSLSVTTYSNDNILNGPCLVFIHGFKGFKDWGFVTFLGEYFENVNFFLITFNFSQNGIGEDGQEFTQLEKFANNAFSKEIEELNEIIPRTGHTFDVKHPFKGLNQKFDRVLLETDNFFKKHLN